MGVYYYIYNYCMHACFLSLGSISISIVHLPCYDLPIVIVAVTSFPSELPSYSTVQVYSLSLSANVRVLVVIVLVVLLSGLRVSLCEGIFNPAAEFVSQVKSSIAPSPPKAVQVNVAVKSSLYSRVIFLGPFSIAGTAVNGTY